MDKKKNSFKNRVKEFYESENAREDNFNLDDELNLEQELMDLELENPEDQNDVA